MYYPKGYDGRTAQTLCTLVESAYQQYAIFKSGGNWAPPEGYALLASISYPLDLRNGFEASDELRKIAKERKVTTGKLDVPIGFVADGSDGRYVIFRGTENAPEWAKNFDIAIVDCFVPGYGKVHKGFQELYLSLKNEVIQALASPNAPAGLYVAGHSLGAALATLAACDIDRNSGKTIANVCTFGSPRVGNRDFSNAYNARFADTTWRVVNSSDLVPEVPPPVQLGPVGPVVIGAFYSHVDTPILFNDQRNSLVDNHDIHTYADAIGIVAAEGNAIVRLLKRFLPRK